jgi:CelD/BcsL family acetyltransferase involved in cellulose biosynthesis
MREDSPSLAALPSVAAEFGVSFTSEAEDVCPQTELLDSWEAYVESLDRKHRHELRRKLRKLPQAGEVELEVLSSPGEIGAEMADFLQMHRASRTEKAAFMTDQMERFFRKLVSALADEGAAEMLFLRLGGKRAAAVMCFTGEEETLLYNSGYDPDYAQFSVGLLSKALALQRAIEQGKKRFDFLRGRERYKYELGAKDFTVYRAVVGRP